MCFHFRLGFYFTLLRYRLHRLIHNKITKLQQISLTQRGDHTYQAIRSTTTRNCRAEAWQAGHVTMFAVFVGNRKPFVNSMIIMKPMYNILNKI
jgi:hypothetical protein